MSDRFTIDSFEATGDKPTYTIDYKGRILCTLSTEADAKAVVSALDEAYNDGYLQGQLWGSGSLL